MKFLKTILGVVVNLSLAVLLGIVLLYLAFLLPNDGIEKHVANSALTIYEEQTYPVLSKDFSSTRDNWTDSIMLLEAANNMDSPTLQRIMDVYRSNVGEYVNPAEVLIRHYVGGEKFDRTYTYPRYWHGFLIFLKPLLLYFDLSTIRIINGLAQALLFFFTSYLFMRKKKDYYLIPWMLGYLLMMPLVIAKSLQYSSCYYIYTLGSLVLLLLTEEKLKKYAAFVFLNIGIALAYFDFLTYPIATFGVPMVVFLMLVEEESMKEKVLLSIKNGLMWSIGYGAMWASKWILASKILGQDIIADGLSQFSERTSSASSGYQIDKLDVIVANYIEFLRTPVIYIAIICIVYLFYMIAKNGEAHKSKALLQFAFYLAIDFSPVVWYCFATNHSAVHVFFTNKACIVSFLAIMFGLVSLAQAKEEDKPNGQDSSTDPVLQ